MLLIAFAAFNSCEKPVEQFPNQTTDLAVENHSSKAYCPAVNAPFGACTDPSQDGQILVKSLLEYYGDNPTIAEVCTAMGICSGSTKEQQKDGYNALTTSGNTATDFTGGTLSGIKAKICEDKPVIVLVREGMDSTKPTVAMLITGFDDGHLIMNNPRDPNGEGLVYSNATFLSVWNALGSQGVEIV